MKRTRRAKRLDWNVEALEQRLLLTGDLEFRTFDGTGNNETNTDWGAANTQLVRLTTVEYGTGDGGDFPAMADRFDTNDVTINPREVSNILFQQSGDVFNDRGLTSFVFQWGQFLDHDMDLTEDPVPVGEALMTGEFVPFFAPVNDPAFPPGTMIPVLRSRFELDDDGVAQQINQITSFIDGSNVYGSDAERAEALRAHYGGFLLTSDGVTNLTDGSGEFLPFNYLVDGEFIENASPPETGTGVPLTPDDLFVAGDVRANEQPGLTSFHTLFVREHNYQARRIADRLGYDDADLSDPEKDEQVYQLARAIVSAEIQSITYNEFIPALLGPDQLETYRGYQDDVNAGIANIFSASLYRVGHTMLPNELLVQNPDGSPVPDNPDVLGAAVINGEVSLGDAFFNPDLITHFGIESYLTGLSNQQIQEIDNFIVDGVRNLLFDPPAAIDLGATNLQRGRDHGLADYNQTRLDFGLDAKTDFSQISSDPDTAMKLETAYDGLIDNIDVFAGAVSEDHIPGGSLGELIHTVLADQFTRLRDGDRFFYENVFHGHKLDEIQNTRFSDIIRRNTDLTDVPDEIFRTEEVLTYRADEGRHGADITLRVRGNRLVVTDGHSNRPVASQRIDDTNIVVLFGTSRHDVIRIDGRVAELSGLSIEVHGGGGKDVLIVEGTRSDDDIIVAPSEVRVNDLSVFYGNIEKIGVDAGRGDDTATVEDDVEALVVVAGGRGNDLLVGGNGNEILSGGPGRDIIVGGEGGDVLFGGRGQDILIGGTTDADLEAARAVWTSELSFNDRVDMLQGVLESQDDGERDFLFGGFGRDWTLDNDGDFSFDWGKWGGFGGLGGLL